jgi:hypothetical protein
MPRKVRKANLEDLAGHLPGGAEDFGTDIARKLVEQGQLSVEYTGGNGVHRPEEDLLTPDADQDEPELLSVTELELEDDPNHDAEFPGLDPQESARISERMPDTSTPEVEPELAAFDAEHYDSAEPEAEADDEPEDETLLPGDEPEDSLDDNLAGTAMQFDRSGLDDFELDPEDDTVAPMHDESHRATNRVGAGDKRDWAGRDTVNFYNQTQSLRNSRPTQPGGVFPTVPADAVRGSGRVGDPAKAKYGKPDPTDPAEKPTDRLPPRKRATRPTHERLPEGRATLRIEPRTPDTEHGFQPATKSVTATVHVAPPSQTLLERIRREREATMSLLGAAEEVARNLRASGNRVMFKRPATARSDTGHGDGAKATSGQEANASDLEDDPTPQDSAPDINTLPDATHEPAPIQGPDTERFESTPEVAPEPDPEAASDPFTDLESVVERIEDSLGRDTASVSELMAGASQRIKQKAEAMDFDALVAASAALRGCIEADHAGQLAEQATVRKAAAPHPKSEPQPEPDQQVVEDGPEPSIVGQPPTPVIAHRGDDFGMAWTREALWKTVVGMSSVSLALGVFFAWVVFRLFS